MAPARLCRAILALALALAACSTRMANAQPACPAVAGYTFYRLQDAAGSVTLATLDAAAATSVSAIADVCASTPRCNAFTAAGQLRIVPTRPVFTALDASASDTQECDGIYVSARSLSGLILPEGVDASTLARDGATKLGDSLAEQAAAKRVAAKLKEKGFDPKAADKLPRSAVAQAFKDANVPQAQTSSGTSGGGYTYSGVVAAITYPVWDSRQANSTSYSFITPVKDQGSCGSCVAFAAVASAEAAVGAGSKTASNSLDLSEQWLFFCDGTGSPSCGGGWYASAATSVIVSKNLPQEPFYPYKAAPTTCTPTSTPVLYAGGAFTRTTIYDLTAAKAHIRTYGSLLTYFAVYNDFFNWNKASAPYKWDGVSSLAGYHQVSVVGYNDTGAFWIVKNSWGTWWGDGGFFRIAYTNGADGSKSCCGDGVCGAGESCSSCSKDCGACPACNNNGICDYAAGERCLSGSSGCADCGACGTGAFCGDGKCTSARRGYTEDCSICAQDCKACNDPLGYCGDGKCTVGRETTSTCSRDCKNSKFSSKTPSPGTADTTTTTTTGNNGNGNGNGNGVGNGNANGVGAGLTKPKHLRQLMRGA
eukprot:XP_001701233.1 cysteine protease-related protein [Chlamydomonas reinhardtii]